MQFHDQRPASPASSTGRASPVPRRAQGDGPYKKDKAYRRYAAGVERALASFDTAQQEWADYISFLARLLKAIQQHPPNVHEVPESDTVATRLAQCLNPSLPSGVHQKALEVFAYTFSLIGHDNLSRDLQLYLPGIAGVLSFASLTVRPLVLSLFAEHILKADAASLRPAAKSVILCLLPGLEETTSEDHERVMRLLEQLMSALRNDDENTNIQLERRHRDSFFWQCFFLAAITNASRRQGALAFLARHLPKFGTAENVLQSHKRQQSLSELLTPAAQSAVSPEPGLLVRCFAAGLRDKQILVQRGFLDLLVTHLPLNSPVLQNGIGDKDLRLLIGSAVSVVARRDMSLNRRLWAWFLGPETPDRDGGPLSPHSPTAESKDASRDPAWQHTEYFAQYGLRGLTESLLEMIQRPYSLPAERARPFRTCLSLMDRWEIGGQLVPNIFIPALQSVFSYSQSASKQDLEEVVRSASNFFDGVESGLIWGKLLDVLCSSSLHDDPSATALSNMKLVKFTLDRFNIRDEEMVTCHIPVVALALLLKLNSEVDKFSEASRNRDSALLLALEVAETLVNLIPERAMIGTPPAEKKTNPPEDADSIEKSIHIFYSDGQGNLEVSRPPFESTQLTTLLLDQTTRLFGSAVEKKAVGRFLEIPTRMACALVSKARHVDVLKESSLAQLLHTYKKGISQIPFATLSAIVNIVVVLSSIDALEAVLSPEEIPKLFDRLVGQLWEYLSPDRPEHHVETVRALWQLEALQPSFRYVESSITAILRSHMLEEKSDSRISFSLSIGRFGVLWTHSAQDKSAQSDRGGKNMSRRTSVMPAAFVIPLHGTSGHSPLTRPLLILLDVLSEDPSSGLAELVKAWLQDLPTLTKVFHVLLGSILTNLPSLTQRPRGKDAVPKSQHSNADLDAYNNTIYHIEHLNNLLRWPSDHTWLTVAQDTISLNESEEDAAIDDTPLQMAICHICMQLLSVDHISHVADSDTDPLLLRRTALSILKQVLGNPHAAPLTGLELEVPLLALLRSDLAELDPLLQTLMLEVILAALKLRSITQQEADVNGQDRDTSREILPTLRRLSVIPEQRTPEHNTGRGSSEKITLPPPEVVDCLRAGFANPTSRLVLDKWVHFLAEVLPLFGEAIFQNLLPLVDSFCSQIKLVFGQLRVSFQGEEHESPASPEPTLISLLNGLEQILADAHQQLLLEEKRYAHARSPDQPQGFLSNMVSGVLSTEAQRRTSTSNSRLTVVLCFQDTVRICFSIWAWGGYGHEFEQDHQSAASFTYTSLRMRNRARRMLEHLFAVETLECLETLATLWCRPIPSGPRPEAVLSLLNVLHGSRPKHTIPAVFTAVYSRTNPSALEPARMSSLTSDLSDMDLIDFLIEYTRSMDDDAMDEIWPDCVAFLKDILSNPLPHRHILPKLLNVSAMLAEKAENTNFGEQRRVRRELGDLFLRLLTATFTTRPVGFLQEPLQPSEIAKPPSINGRSLTNPGGQNDLMRSLASVVPLLQLVLIDNDRVATATTNISTNVIAPVFRSKSYSSNISLEFLDILYQLTQVSPGSKAWKKDVADAFNDPKFFSTPFSLIKERWLPILQQWILSDKERMTELLQRLTAPTTAGIVFGVGATSARLEADRRTQLTLRRIALLVLAAPEDSFMAHLRAMEEKIIELTAATAVSSPSSITRAEIFMLLRAVVLRTSPTNLAPFWPIINSELRAALISVVPEGEQHETYSNTGLIQACHLLDLLIAISPDEFELHEWLFVTDTIDAIYRPTDWTPAALADEVAEDLASTDGTAALMTPAALPHTASNSGGDGKRRPYLQSRLEISNIDDADIKSMPKSELATRILRPYLGQLSIVAFESTYEMGEPDLEACVDGLLRDLCDGRSIAGQ